MVWRGSLRRAELRPVRVVVYSTLLNFFGGLTELERAANIAVESADQTPALNQAVLGRVIEFVGDNEMGASGVAELQSVLELAEAFGISKHLRIDPSLARGLSYYTGAIMEISVKDLAGSLAGGGRYDSLVGMFLGQDVPACGFSLGLERIIVVMGERNMFPARVGAAAADVMVAIWSEETIAESVRLAQELRAGGLTVDLYPEADKLGKQFKYASARGVPFVAVLGDDERTRGEVAIKNMGSGEQRSVPRASVVAELQQQT